MNEIAVVLEGFIGDYREKLRNLAADGWKIVSAQAIVANFGPDDRGVSYFAVLER